MIINMTHLNAIQSQITDLVSDYIEEISSAVSAFHSLGHKESLKNIHMQDLSDTYKKRFSGKEQFQYFYSP